MLHLLMKFWSVARVNHPGTLPSSQANTRTPANFNFTNFGLGRLKCMYWHFKIVGYPLTLVLQVRSEIRQDRSHAS